MVHLRNRNKKVLSSYQKEKYEVHKEFEKMKWLFYCENEEEPLTYSFLIKYRPRKKTFAINLRSKFGNYFGSEGKPSGGWDYEAYHIINEEDVKELYNKLKKVFEKSTKKC